MERKSLFASQQSEDLKLQSKIFYKAQDKYVKKHKIKYSKTKHYICKPFFQRIVVVQQKLILAGKKNKNVEWLFQKSLDIMIRQNLTDSFFIRNNDVMKGCFYNNAMYRCFRYTLKTYNHTKGPAFVYFTSSIRNAFKEEHNKYMEMIKTQREIQKIHGLDTSITNIDSKNINELEQDYDIEYTVREKENISMFISDINKRFGKLKTLSIVLNPNEPRFKRKRLELKNFLSVKTEIIDGKKVETGIVFKYIDLLDYNEESGLARTKLQNEIIKIRKAGHQVFYLFSDIYLSEDIKDEDIFSKVEELKKNILENSSVPNGKDLMFSYIPLDQLEILGYTEPNFYMLDKDREERKLIFQDEDKFKEYKSKDNTITRTFDAGMLNTI